MEANAGLLLDVTRDVAQQLEGVASLSAVALTHAHRDAAGGLAVLARWWRERELEPLPLYACAEAIAVVRQRYRRLDHLRPVPVEPGARVALDGLTLSAVEVPHALDRRYRTYAWRVESDRCTFVYASDVGRVEPPLERLAHDAQLLIVDGAMWRRRLFSHLTIDQELPRLCGWPVEQILLTQIGRTVPPHEQLERAARALCPKAAPAWDGLVVELS
jgi:ribonuclease BN (tRNA processing enzyme)